MFLIINRIKVDIVRQIGGVAPDFPRRIGYKQDLFCIFKLKEQALSIIMQMDLCGETVKNQYSNGVFALNKIFFYRSISNNF